MRRDGAWGMATRPHTAGAGDQLRRYPCCAMAVSLKKIICLALVALASYHQPSRAFVSSCPTTCAANHQRETAWSSTGSKPAVEHLRATTTSGPAALFSVKEAERAEVMEALYGASYDERVEKGKAAQGFLTSDAHATRALVPPRELTYGEYGLDFFLSLVRECLSLRVGGDGTDDVAAIEAEAR